MVSWATDPDGVGTLSVTRIGPGSDTLAARRFLYDGVPTTDELADSLIAGPAEVLPMVLGLPEGQVRSQLEGAIDLPPHRPPVRRLERGAAPSWSTSSRSTWRGPPSGRSTPTKWRCRGWCG